VVKVEQVPKAITIGTAGLADTPTEKGRGYRARRFGR
jgi:hypothetical protein